SHCAVIRDIETLCERLNLPESFQIERTGPDGDFPLRVPHHFLQQMEPGNPADPLLLQVLLQQQESEQVDGFSCDPVDDLQSSVTPGLIHKYHNRVLLTVTGACAIHCRYCFRRNFPYSSENPRRDNWDSALAYISQHPEIEEVILSGGDPLMMELEGLKALVQRIESIAHIERLRIHTRIPVAAPEMVNQSMFEWFEKIALPLVMVIHSNHPNELSPEVTLLTKRLSQAGITLYNQSVLLKGVNDHADILARLSKRLFDAGVQPYYLNLLDRAHGTAHFEVSDSRARKIISSLEKLLPGYLMPKVVRDKGNNSGKVVFGFESL
ncbi:MAG: EF-P beta-lysylation protein EpmB, partial [Gammaproteobacteria bacterium]|nr:EF-P beta-lysylation protein EpmB [Gammaproteobacteria bacterium]